MVFLLGFQRALVGVRGVLAEVSPAAPQAGAVADLAASIEAQEGRLGTGKGEVVLDQPGRIGREISLGKGHDLVIRAPVAWDATVHVLGQNRVHCGPGGRIEAGTPVFEFEQPQGALLLAKGVQQVSVDGCVVHGSAQSVLLAALPASDVEMSGNTLTGVTLLATNNGESDRLRLDRNSVTSTGGSVNAAVLLFFAEGVEASGNTFTGVMHGVEWWGGNSGDAGTNLAQVTKAGRMQFEKNVCKGVSGSCIWGSMGHDIVIRGNSADGCGDVCFDTEGGLRTEISGNTATGCRNGCAAIFFFTDQTVIAGNHFYGPVPGGGLIFIKNASQDPARHDHLRVEGNELDCGADPCNAVFQEAVGGTTFATNTVTNGVWFPAGFGRDVRILRNHIVFTKQLLAGGAAIYAPDVIGGSALVVEGNRVESRVLQPRGSMCVQARWSDYNAADRHLIDGNTCVGVGGAAAFPVGLRVVSAGQNAGLQGVWIVGGNAWSGGTVEHTVTPGAREQWLDLQDAAARATARALPGCAGGAEVKTQPGTTPVCLGGAEGMVNAAVARE